MEESHGRLVRGLSSKVGRETSNRRLDDEQELNKSLEKTLTA